MTSYVLVTFPNPTLFCPESNLPACQHLIKYLVVSPFMGVIHGKTHSAPPVARGLILVKHLYPAVCHVLRRVRVHTTAQGAKDEGVMSVGGRHSQGQPHLGFSDVAVSIAREDGLAPRLLECAHPGLVDGRDRQHADGGVLIVR